MPRPTIDIVPRSLSHDRHAANTPATERGVVASWIGRVGWLLAGMLLGGAVSAGAASSRADTIYQKLEVLAEVLAFVENQYVEPVNTRAAVYGAAEGVVRTLDAHSAFFPPQAYRELIDSTEGEYAGVGLELELRAGVPEVVTVLDNSPAQRAGLMQGDQVVAIDGIPTEGSGFDAITESLKGPPGTKVVLTVGRSNRPAPWNFTVVRNWIRITPLKHRAMAHGVHYVGLRMFARSVATDLKDLLADKAVQGIILDLRDNPGGLFDEAIEVCDLFLKGGPVVTAVGRGGRLIEERTARDRAALGDVPIAVLIDEGSASAAEIVAGALKDRGRARLFGSRSYGKGTVQSIVDLSDGSGLKLTVARYVTPSGESIDGVGIDPHEQHPAATASADSAQLAAAKWVTQQQ